MIHHRRDIFLCLTILHQIDEELLHYTIILTTCELNEFYPRCSEKCRDVLLVVLTWVLIGLQEDDRRFIPEML